MAPTPIPRTSNTGQLPRGASTVLDLRNRNSALTVELKDVKAENKALKLGFVHMWASRAKLPVGRIATEREETVSLTHYEYIEKVFKELRQEKLFKFLQKHSLAFDNLTEEELTEYFNDNSNLKDGDVDMGGTTTVVTGAGGDGEPLDKEALGIV